MESINLVFTAQDTVEVRKEPVDSPGPGQILVETQRTLISTGTELICFGRKFAPGTSWERWVRYPFYPGYSNAGKVLEVGEGGDSLKPGDRVAFRRPHMQYFLADAGQALQIPDSVSDEEATWFGIACIVQNSVRRAMPQMGDAIVAIGMGILGQMVVQYSRLMGAKEVIAVDLAHPRLEMAAAHGATCTLEMDAGQAIEAVRALTDGRLADIVFDVTGHAPVFSLALQMARRFGKVIILGDTGTPGEQRLTSDVINRGLQIIGTHDVDPPQVSTDHAYWTRSHMARLFFTYLERGQMRVNDLVTHHFSPHEAPEVYGMLAHDRSGAMGVVFDWSQV